jgi:hypothetical protein
MESAQFFTQMANTAEAVRSLAAGVTEAQARWKPDPQSWSILEVVNHLYDDERQDFRAPEIILFQPDKPWRRRPAGLRKSAP